MLPISIHLMGMRLCDFLYLAHRHQDCMMHAAHLRLVNTIQKINGCSFPLIHSWYQTKAPFCYSLEAPKQVMEQLVSHRLLVIRKKVLSYLSWWLNLQYGETLTHAHRAYCKKNCGFTLLL